MHSLASRVADLQQNGCRTLLMSCTVWPLFPCFIVTNDWCVITFGDLPLGCVIAQVIGCWLFTTGASVWYQDRPHGFCDVWQWYWNRFFFEYFNFLLSLSFHQFPICIFICVPLMLY